MYCYLLHIVKIYSRKLAAWVFALAAAPVRDRLMTANAIKNLHGEVYCDPFSLTQPSPSML